MWLTRTQILILGVVGTALAQQCSRSKPCETHACCSKWGNCGYGPDFCENGCQNNCSAKPDCGQYALEFDCPLRVCCSKWGFCGTSEEFCNKECQGNCEQPPEPSCSSPPSPQVNIGYYASWASTRRCKQYKVEDIDANLYSHLNYAFVDVEDGVIAPLSAEESDNLKRFSRLKEINPNLKVLISVGGWAFNDPGPRQQEFHNIALSKESRKRFIDSVKEFLIEYNFDGIDIDWEYPAADDRGGSPEDKENYLLLVYDMRRVFRSKYLITIAAPASYWYLRHFNIGEMAQHLDWINVMTYDIHGVWDETIESLGPWVKTHTDITEIEPAIGLFVKDGVPFEKLVLGLGYYGRSFTLKNPSCTEYGCEFSGPGYAGECTDAPGTLAWFEIVEIAKRQDLNPQETTNTTGQTKILVFDRDQWVGYDDEGTLEFKRNWAKERCMMGTMIWSIDQGLDQYKRGGSAGAIRNKYQQKVPSNNYVTKNRIPNDMYPPKPQKANQYGKPGFNRGI